jgi:hypothetical protein
MSHLLIVLGVLRQWPRNMYLITKQYKIQLFIVNLKTLFFNLIKIVNLL